MITNSSNLPISVAVWLAQDDYDHVNDPAYISATSILKPTKAVVLGNSLAQEGDVDITNLVASRMGTAIHTAIEDAWTKNPQKTMKLLGYPQKLIDALKVNPDPSTVTEDDFVIYQEVRTIKEIDGWKVGGKFDFICDGQLEDFKSTSVYTYINQSNAEKYVQQGSIYRWLNPTLVTNDVMRINYVFTDWSAAKAKQTKDYPPARILSQEYPLMTIQETEAFIREKLSKINSSINADQSQMPECTSEDLWERPTVYKYYKNPAKKTRSTGNFDSYWEAHKRFSDDGSVGEIVTVRGEVMACKYCPASGVCEQAQMLVQEGRLNL